MKHYDVIIVGGGATGASALYHLAKRGITNTLLLEKKEGYGRGATGSWGSLIRMFHVSLDVTRRASQSVPFYMSFEDHVGHKNSFNKLGSLYFIKKTALSSFAEHIKVLEASGMEFQIVEPNEGRERFPDYLWYEDDVAIYEPNAGVACPWGTTEGLIQYAVSRGATSLLNTKVTDIEFNANRAKAVSTDNGEQFSCDQLVLATGMWTSNIVERAGSHIAIYPEVIQLNRFCREHAARQHPLFIDLTHRTFGHSSFNGSFVGGYIQEIPKTPQGRKAVQHVSLHEANVAKHKLSMRLPWIGSSTLEGGMRAIDSYTQAKVGIIEFDPKYPNLLVSAGWSCGGFTTAPENGKNITEKLLGNR